MLSPRSESSSAGENRFAPRLVVRPDRHRHFSGQPRAFRNASILRIIETCVGDLQALDRGANGGNPGCEAGLAKGLRVAQPADKGRHTVAVVERGVDAFETGEA